MRVKELEGGNRLEMVLFGIGLCIMVLLMILIVIHTRIDETDAVIARADESIARSEAALERWDHGNGKWW